MPSRAPCVSSGTRQFGLPCWLPHAQNSGGGLWHFLADIRGCPGHGGHLLPGAPSSSWTGFAFSPILTPWPVPAALPPFVGETRSLTALANGQLILECPADASSPPHIEWHREGSLLQVCGCGGGQPAVAWTTLGSVHRGGWSKVLGSWQHVQDIPVPIQHQWVVSGWVIAAIPTRALGVLLMEHLWVLLGGCPHAVPGRRALPPD